MFEILYFSTEFIGKIYKILDREECIHITKCFRLYDLISKRFMALQFITYIKTLQNKKFVSLNARKIRKQMKNSIKTALKLQSNCQKIQSVNLLHQLDYIRGYILIQERFYHIWKNQKDSLEFFQKKCYIS